MYPSLKKSTGTKSRANKSTTDEAAETEVDTSQKSTRKRKLKPHAAQYLQPPSKPSKPTKSTVEKQAIESGGGDDKPQPKKAKKKNLLEQIIEKNMKNVPAAEAKKKADVDENDKDYDVNEEEAGDDEDDEDADFKLKCQNNLKLSKKIKKSQLKQSKEAKEKEAKPKDEVTVAKATASEANKKVKKGFATTKQRLGKLLKLNRCVNI